jgi:hypothetical protein
MPTVILYRGGSYILYLDLEDNWLRIVMLVTFYILLHLYKLLERSRVKSDFLEVRFINCNFRTLLII